MRRVLGFLAVALAAGPAAGQSKTGTTIGQFTGIEPSSRIAAMGGAGVAVPDDIQAVFYNPAALGAADRVVLQFTHGFWFADIAYNYAAVVVPAGDWGNFFGSVTMLNSGEIDVRTVDKPLGTGERYTVEDVALSVGYGRQITHRFAAGVQVNFLGETIWHSSMHALTLGVGTAYRLTASGVTLGASLSHFGTSGQFDGDDLAIQYDNDPSRYGDNSALPADQFTDEFPVPVLFRVGLSFPRRLSAASQLLVAFDAFHPNDNTESLSGGWEWLWKDAFAVRAGYQHLGQQDSEYGLTAGLGVRGGLGTHRFHADYAWAYHATLLATHRLTFVLAL